MKFLLYVAYAFINTFGITQPTPDTAKRAARYIAAMVAAVLLFVTVVAMILHHSFIN